MSGIFHSITSPLSRVQLTRQFPMRDEQPQTETTAQSLSKFLSQVGCNRLADVFKRMEGHRVELRLDDNLGAFDIHRAHFSQSVRSFFPTSHFTSSTSRSGGRSTQANECDLKVYRLGSCSSAEAGHETQLFWSSLAVPLSGDTAKRAAIYWEQSPRDVVGNEVAVIPSAAGLTPSDAVSLTAPIYQSPCEYVFYGNAGALISFTPNTFQIKADLSWTPEAYLGSLHSLQEIGHWLVNTRAIEYAIKHGTGLSKLRNSSSLLSKAYETVAQVGQTHFQPFMVSGLWGVAVLPRPKESYDHLLQVGVVGLMIDQDNVKDLGNLTLIRERSMVIVNLHLTRDRFGFVSMTPDKVSRFPLQEIEWHSTLPTINLPKV